MSLPERPFGPSGPGGDLAAAARLTFALFHEVQVLAQVSAALLGARLPAGLAPMQWGILNHLARTGAGASGRQLAQAFQVPSGIMEAMVATLERRGLVEREAVRGRIVATASGRACRDRAMADLAPEVAALARRFAPDRMTALMPELAALRRIMDGMREG